MTITGASHKKTTFGSSDDVLVYVESMGKTNNGL